jgi:hypothetical protein
VGKTEKKKEVACSQGSIAQEEELFYLPQAMPLLCLQCTSVFV